jgi:hypothetical protein
MRILAVVLSFLLLSSPAPAGKLWQAFQNHVRASGAELAAVDRGEAISKMLSSGNEREITAFGMIQVAASGDVLVQRFRDITNFKKAEQVLEIGKFSPSPILQDLKSLTLEAEESAALKACDVGRCDLKLSRAMIQRARRDSRVTNSSDLLKQILFDYLRSYLSTGNSALAKYEDKSTPGDLAREFQDLLNTAPYLRDYAPEFVSYLQAFPQNKPQGVEEFVYWSKEKFGLKPVISLTHVFIYRRLATDEVLIVSKQIYASHYFDASVGITGLVAASRPGERSRSYLLYLNRSRVDALGGILGGVATSLLKGQIQEGMATNLKLAKQRLERP